MDDIPDLLSMLAPPGDGRVPSGSDMSDTSSPETTLLHADLLATVGWATDDSFGDVNPLDVSNTSSGATEATLQPVEQQAQAAPFGGDVSPQEFLAFNAATAMLMQVPESEQVPVPMLGSVPLEPVQAPVPMLQSEPEPEPVPVVHEEPLGCVEEMRDVDQDADQVMEDVVAQSSRPEVDPAMPVLERMGKFSLPTLQEFMSAKELKVHGFFTTSDKNRPTVLAVNNESRDKFVTFMPIYAAHGLKWSIFDGDDSEIRLECVVILGEMDIPEESDLIQPTEHDGVHIGVFPATPVSGDGKGSIYSNKLQFWRVVSCPFTWKHKKPVVEAIYSITYKGVRVFYSSPLHHKCKTFDRTKFVHNPTEHMDQFVLTLTRIPGDFDPVDDNTDTNNTNDGDDDDESKDKDAQRRKLMRKLLLELKRHGNMADKYTQKPAQQSKKRKHDGANDSLEDDDGYYEDGDEDDDDDDDDDQHEEQDVMSEVGSVVLDNAPEEVEHGERHPLDSSNVHQGPTPEFVVRPYRADHPRAIQVDSVEAGPRTLAALGAQRPIESLGMLDDDALNPRLSASLFGSAGCGKSIIVSSLLDQGSDLRNFRSSERTSPPTPPPGGSLLIPEPNTGKSFMPATPNTEMKIIMQATAQALYESYRDDDDAPTPPHFGDDDDIGFMLKKLEAYRGALYNTRQAKLQEEEEEEQDVMSEVGSVVLDNAPEEVERGERNPLDSSNIHQGPTPEAVVRPTRINLSRSVAVSPETRPRTLLAALDPQRPIEHLDLVNDDVLTHPPVLFVGNMCSGKSTLVNTLMGSSLIPERNTETESPMESIAEVLTKDKLGDEKRDAPLPTPTPIELLPTVRLMSSQTVSASALGSSGRAPPASFPKTSNQNSMASAPEYKKQLKERSLKMEKPPLAPGSSIMLRGRDELPVSTSSINSPRAGPSTGEPSLLGTTEAERHAIRFRKMFSDVVLDTLETSAGREPIILGRRDELPVTTSPPLSPLMESLLPTVADATIEFPSIDSSTVADILSGEYDDLGKRIMFVDCRFPYEHDGGHIKGAHNLYMVDQLDKMFFERELPDADQVIVVFYCEFSSHRAPKMCRRLRMEDRKRNAYPKLTYPHLYVLKGGYKSFFEAFPSKCLPPDSYVPMQAPGYESQCKENMREMRRKWKRKSSTMASSVVLGMDSPQDLIHE